MELFFKTLLIAIWLVVLGALIWRWYKNSQNLESQSVTVTMNGESTKVSLNALKSIYPEIAAVIEIMELPDVRRGSLSQTGSAWALTLTFSNGSSSTYRGFTLAEINSRVKSDFKQELSDESH